eukprot:CAMPEP_0118631876 /NCGR_PEP_ID=MMETSP0785-20121206/139_1 /TAXON_ID=91992 /ORGANISM="Bolidomonas pacifica, Strain CCMP 1866" /LENGTH=436 /DNA_ID=CAMNT_0006522597 /DNA_START=1302 /DNA_END=2609 /DNA_ORIENTATION=+
MNTSTSLFKRIHARVRAGAESGAADYPLDIAELELPVKVKVSVKIVKILNIDTSANTFLCDYILTCKWEDNSFLAVVDGTVQKSDVQMSRHFVPEYDVANLVEVNQSTNPEFEYYRRKDSNTCRVAMKQRITGVFYEHFELASFPFDLQSLSVKVRARQDINTVQFTLASQTKYPSVFSGTRFTLPEWDYLCPPGTPFVKTENVGVTTGNKQPHSMFIFNQPVSRKIGYYICNVVPLYFLIVSFGLVAFGNDPSDLANRLNALIALLLTSTAFKYIYKESLPRVHYLTRLDYYMYWEHLFIVVQGFFHAWAKIALEAGWRSLEEIRDFEIICCAGMAALWVFLHLVLVNWAKGHRALLDLDADTLEETLKAIEDKDRENERRRKRGLFALCWKGKKKSSGGVTDSGRTFSTSSVIDNVIEDYELGALFEMEDYGDF